MRWLWSIFTFIGLTLLLTQFTNCDVYSDNSLFKQMASTQCEQTDCSNSNDAFLELKVNTDAGEIIVGPEFESIDIGGECNEGGFAKNTVTWQLYDSTNQFIHGSNKVGKNTTCVKGRFQIKVMLVDPAGANRKGLKYPNGKPGLHRLDVVLRAETEAGEAVESPAGRRSIWLRPFE